MNKSNIWKKLEELRTKQKFVDQTWQKTGNRGLLNFFIEILPRTLDAERCSIFILDPVDNEVWLQCGTDLKEKQVSVPKTNSIVGKVISSGKYTLEENLENQLGVHDIIAVKTGFTTKNVLCVPVFSVSNDRVTGAIQILNKNDGKKFSEQDRGILERLAVLLQFNVENIFFRQEMVKISVEIQKEIESLQHRFDKIAETSEA